MPDVFITYSRRASRAFVERLHEALEENGQNVWVDWEDIPPASVWQKDLDDGVVKSHAYVFVISEEAIQSRYCLGELDLATELGKRIIPVKHQDVEDEARLPEPISTHNWIPQEGVFEQDFERGLEALVRAIRIDFAWVRAHTQWGTLAQEWERNERDDSFLLRGSQLGEAEKWLAGEKGKDPSPTEQQKEYILESRAAEVRRQRRFVTGAVVVSIVAMALAAVALVGWLNASSEKRKAQAERQKAESRALAIDADKNLGSDLGLAVLLGLEAHRLDPSVEARSALVSAAERTDHLIQFLPIKARVAALSPDGRRIALGGEDGRVQLWDVPTARTLGPSIRAHGEGVSTLVFSPDGEKLASAGGEGHVFEWDVGRDNLTRGRRLETGYLFGAEALAFDPKGDRLAAAGEGPAIVWQLSESGLHTRRLAQASGAGALVFGRDGHELMVASEQRVATFDARSGRRLRSVPFSGSDPDRVSAGLVLSPDGARFATTDYDGTMRVWSTSTGRRSAWAARDRRAIGYGVAFSPDGETLATGGFGGAVQLWRVADGRRVGRALSGHRGSVPYISFGPRGAIVSTDNRGTVIRSRTESALAASLDPNAGPLLSVAFSHSGKALAAGGGRGGKQIYLWQLDRRTSSELPPGHRDAIVDLAFRPPRDDMLASAGYDGEVRIWDVPGRRPIGQLAPPSGLWGTVAFSPDGTKLAGGGGGPRLTLWRIPERRKLGTLPAGELGLRNVAFSPDGSEIAGGSFQGRLYLWDIARQRVRKSLDAGQSDEVEDVAFSPDGKAVATAGYDGTVAVWDVAHGRRLGRPLTGHQGEVTLSGVAYSPDGRTLASAGQEDGAIRLWDVSTRQPLGGPLRLHDGPIRAIAFRPDGGLLASASEDGRVLLWKSMLWKDDGALVSRLCSLVGRNLTRSEWRQYLPLEPYRNTCKQWPEGR